MTSFNIIAAALSELSAESKDAIVTHALRTAASRALRSPAASIEDAVSKAAHALQKPMDATAAQSFAFKLLQETGIDARLPRYRSFMPCDTAEDWQALAQHCSKADPARSPRYYQA